MDGNALSVQQTATKLGFAPATVREMLNARIIRGVKLGGRWRVDPSEIDRLFQKTPERKRKSLQRARAAMARLGLPPHHGAFAPEARGMCEPSEYLDAQAVPIT